MISKKKFYYETLLTGLNNPANVTHLDNKLGISELHAYPILNRKKPTLDLKIALQYAGNQKILAKKLLKILLSSFPPLKKELHKLLQTKNLNDNTIKHLIHQLHGSCNYCGASKLKALCQHIEEQLYAGRSLTELHLEWLCLLNEINQVSKLAKRILSSD